MVACCCSCVTGFDDAHAARIHSVLVPADARARPRARPDRVRARRHTDPRRRDAPRRQPATAGSCSAPTAAASRRCCGSPPSTSIRRAARCGCSARRSGAPTCACCGDGSATTRPALSADLRPALTAVDVVMTAKYAALEPWWHQYTDADRQRAVACLAAHGRRPRSPTARSARCRPANASACCWRER